jgi:hypothetical protein
MWLTLSTKPRAKMQYIAIVPQYKPEEFRQFPELLAMLVNALEREPTDVLGKLYHRLEIHNEQRGQLFTPYPVCLAMAKIVYVRQSHPQQVVEHVESTARQ